jgi:hypothetical protein
MSTANTRSALGWSLGIAAVIVAVATIAAAISVMGTPGEQRAARIDERRVDDLQALEFDIRAFAEKNGRLPGDLSTLARLPGRRLSLRDPERRTPYEYRVTADNTYQLCAVFRTDTAVSGNAEWRKQWAHGVGRTCFDRLWKRRKAAMPAIASEPGTGHS